ncbi:MAG: DUF5684 domain-containing protein [Thermodesulfovibrionales bacterium]
MKKTVFVIMALLIAVMVSGTAYAKAVSEYDAAVKSYYSGKYKDAVRHLEGYIAQHPDPAAYYLMGYSLYKLKRFDEANEYFRDAYLINPAYTPIKESAGQPVTRKPRKVIKPETEAAAAQKPAESQTKQPQQESAQKPAPPVQPDKKPAIPQAAPAPAPQQSAPPVASPPTPAAPVAPAAPQPGPQPVQPPVPMQPLPMPSQKLPDGAGGLALLMGGLFAGSLLLVFGILLAFYVFFSLCMYLIAKKLNVPAAWTAWVPLLNLWAFVGSAGKPWWWILLLFVPLVNFFVGIYLWLCITENLGKNKWLGLLMLVPIVNMIFLAVLAFSKDTGSAPAATELE